MKTISQLLLAFGVASASSNTLAYTFCVGTSAELQNAIDQGSSAATATGEAMEIRVRAGGSQLTATLPPDMIHANSQGHPRFKDLSIKGGYTDIDCQDSGRKIDARLTSVRILPDGGGVDDLAVYGDLLIEGLTLELDAYIDRAVDHAVKNVVRATRIAGNGLKFRAVWGQGSHDYEVSGNVVSAPSSSTQCGIEIWNAWYDANSMPIHKTTGKAVLTNNTFVDNPGGGLCVAAVDDIVLANNIFWNNAAGGVIDMFPKSLPTPVKLHNNVIQGENVFGKVVYNESPLFANPDLAPNPPVGTLLPTSGALNTGWDGAIDAVKPITDAAGNTVDLYGSPRVTGSQIDRGAVESFVDDSEVVLVRSNANSGLETLRSAIDSINNSNTTKERVIRFDFDDTNGNGDKCDDDSTIVLQSPLPAIAKNVYIDGYSAKGARRNWNAVGFGAKVCVRLVADPLNPSKPSVALETSSGARLAVSGLQFNGFGSAAISLNSGTFHRIQGNIFGGDSSGAFADGNGRGIYVSSGVDGVTIGGNGAPDRNWITRSSGEGIVLGAALGSVIGNLIGPDRFGKANGSTQNLRGIQINGDDNYVSYNTVSGNSSDAVTIASGADRNSVFRNNLGYVDGLACSGLCVPGAPNRRGVLVFGNDNKIHENDIGYNQQQGIAIGGAAAGNSLRYNRISENGGLGIELAGGPAHSLDGAPSFPQLADVKEPVSGAINGNFGQNFAELVFAVGLPKPSDATATGTVAGTLSSRNGHYEIQVYANPTCSETQGVGEGSEFIGLDADLEIDNEVPGLGFQDPADGVASFAIDVASKTALIGRHITAIAVKTDDPRKGSTSEFSQCLQFTEVQPVPDNEPPVFAAQTFPLLESSPAGAQITLQASDDFKPNPPGVLEFSMQDQTVPFSLDGPTGVLTQVGEDIFKDTDQYQFDVTVTDGQDSVTATITIQKQLEGIFRDGFEDPQP